MEEVRAADLFQTVQPIQAIDVERNAKEDAFQQRPDSIAISIGIGTTERSIVDFFTECLNKERAKAQNLLSFLEADRNKISVDGILQIAESIPQETQTDVKSDMMSGRNELVNLQFAEQQAYSAKKIFMRENNLNKPAYYPESLVFSVAILATLVLFESMGNAYFFATGSELGYLGGILQAILVSLANVVVIAGLGGAWVARYCNHVSTSLRYAALSMLSVFFLFTCAFNLLVAHYRIALQSSPDTAITQATQRFVTHTFALANFDAWILFVLGLGAAIFAGYKWYSMDDHYPGYGSVDRHHKKAQQDFSNAQQRICNQINKRFRDANEKIVECATRMEQAVQQYQALLQQSRRVVDQYPIYRQHIQNLCNQEINRYRTINQQIRATPPPVYFKDLVSIDDPIGVIAKIGRSEEQRANHLQASRELFLTNTRQEVGDKLRKIQSTSNQETHIYFQKILDEAKHRNVLDAEAIK